MSGETRANLIVVAAVLALLIPGGLFVVRKKLDPTVKPMGRPDGLKRHLVFIDQTPAPPGMRRMVPAAVAAWVNDLSLARLGTPMLTTGAGELETERAIMSNQRLAQLVAARHGAETSSEPPVELGLLIWNIPRGTDRAAAQLSVAGDARVEVVSSELIIVPAEVKRDFEYSGLPAPPQEVLWIQARLLPASSFDTTDSVGLTITCIADGRTLTDLLRFTPGPAPNQLSRE